MRSVQTYDRTVTVTGNVERGGFEYFTTARFHVLSCDGSDPEADLDAVDFSDAPPEGIELTDDELYRLEKKAIRKAEYDYWA